MRTGYHKGTRKGVNPFVRFLSKEDHFQHQVSEWCKWNKVRYHHSPLEGKRSEFEQFKFVYLGGDSGFIDMIYPKLMMVQELKIKPNRVMPAQQGWLDFFASIGWEANVAWNFDEAIQQIKQRVSLFRGLYT